MKEIYFTDTLSVSSAYEPKPASKFIPSWYKNLSPYMGDKKESIGLNGEINATIKKCLPVFDAITAGYIITSYTDVNVTQVEENGVKYPHYSWPHFSPIEFHNPEQAPNHPQRNNMPIYPKWVNPWSIKTPKGFSVYITQPMHRESVFTILDGIVDTDTYDVPINFPFVLKDPNFSGLIPAGTPIAQVIPFKRDEWEMKIGNKKQLENQNKTKVLLRSVFYEGYKNMFRNAKVYK